MRTLDRALMIVLTTLVGVSLAAGCGDDGDGGGGDVSTGIAPTKLLSDVTDEEAATACQRMQAGYERVFNEDKVTRAFCTLIAAASAANPSECATLRDECINSAEPAPVEGVDGLACEDTDTSELAECTGTVGDLETCVNDTLDAFEAALNQFSCDDAPVDMENFEGFEGFEAETPASCEAVGCPEGSLFGGEEESL